MLDLDSKRGMGPREWVNLCELPLLRQKCDFCVNVQRRTTTVVLGGNIGASVLMMFEIHSPCCGSGGLEPRGMEPRLWFMLKSILGCA